MISAGPVYHIIFKLCLLIEFINYGMLGLYTFTLISMDLVAESVLLLPNSS